MAGVFAHTVRPAMLAASRADRLRRTVERSPVTRKVVRRFVPGDTLDSVLDIVAALRDSGRYVSIDYLGENVTDADDAAADRAGVPAAARCAGSAGRYRATACGRWRCRSSFRRWGRRWIATERRSRWTTPAPSASGPSRWVPGSRWTPKTTPLPIRRCRSPATCASTSVAGHGFAGLPASHARRLQGAGLRRSAGPVVQGRLRRTGVGGLSGLCRDHRLLPALPAGADGRLRAIRWWPPMTR